MVLIFIKQKEELNKFDFLTNVHNKLVDHFRVQIDSLQPINLKGQEGLFAYLGRVFHLSKDETKVILNQLSERNLCEIRRGCGIANYYVLIKKGIVSK